MEKSLFCVKNVDKSVEHPWNGRNFVDKPVEMWMKPPPWGRFHKGLCQAVSMRIFHFFACPAPKRRTRKNPCENDPFRRDFLLNLKHSGDVQSARERPHFLRVGIIHFFECVVHRHQDKILEHLYIVRVNRLGLDVYI